MKWVLAIASRLLALLGLGEVLVLRFAYGVSPWVSVVLLVVTLLAVFISRQTVEIYSAVLFTASVGWLLECCEVLGYALLYGAWNEIPTALLLAIIAVASVSLFLSACEWEKIQGGKAELGKLTVLLLCLMAFPVGSYAYKTYDKEDVSFRLYIAGDGRYGIEFSDAEGERYRVKMSDKDVFMELLSKTQYGICNKCTVRLKGSFRRLLSLEFVYSDDAKSYFDFAKMRLPEGCRTGVFDMEVEDLRW